jgi:hypothetical protein
MFLRRIVCADASTYTVLGGGELTLAYVANNAEMKKTEENAKGNRWL